MDGGRFFYFLLRFYVWGLFLLGIMTVFLLVLPRSQPNPMLAAAWFAVGGFGALVLVIAVLVYLYD